MHPPVQDKVPGTVVDILAAAVAEYCAAFAEITDEIDHGRDATPQQLERAMAATLRLENAQTLFDLEGRGRRDDDGTTSRRLH
jgi:hypothetical protein